MKRFKGVFLALVMVLLIWVLDNPLHRAGLPALGRILDPVNGLWANGERYQQQFDDSLSFKEINNSANVDFDVRLVPHIQAANDHDLYFLLGYAHARFRLWQMDIQTRAAAGRLSEVIGKKTFDFDRAQRRKGMVFAAEKSLQAMEKDKTTRVMLSAYTEGVNAYIATLNYRTLPLEYKLMGFKPEPWTNLKCVLIMKYMADELTGSTDDIAMSYLKEKISPKTLELLFPLKIAGSATVIPRGTPFAMPSLQPPVAPKTEVAFPRISGAEFSSTKVEGKGRIGRLYGLNCGRLSWLRGNQMSELFLNLLHT